MSNGVGLQLLNTQLKNFLDNKVLKMTFRLATENVRGGIQPGEETDKVGRACL